MDLGNVVLRRSSINSLFKALHPRHGLAWTDGKNVFLSPVTIQNYNLKPSNPIKLGEFDSIQSLCWSCDFSGGWCYLCVTQYQKVSIWRVEGTNANLKLKLVRKISKNPLPQGCLWNPVRDILAIVTTEQCNLYFRHSDKKSSLSLPFHTQNSSLRCACWSDQGDRLYVATKTTVWIFTWANIDHKIKEFSSDETPLTGYEGSVLTMTAIGKDYILLTKELPLDKLCIQQNLTVDMDEAVKSPTDTLMNLTATRSASTSSSSASLALVATNGPEVKIVSETNISGLLAPDLLSYSFDGKSQLVVVGSNTQSTLQFYTISGLGTFDKQHDIMLPDSERPKGLCKSSLPQSVFILVGKLKNTGSALPSLDKDEEYELKLSITKLYPSDVLQSSMEPVAPNTTGKISNVATAGITELPPSSDQSGTLLKINNAMSSSSDSGDVESVLVRDTSTTHLKTHSQSLSMHNTNNQSYSSLPSGDKFSVAAGDRGDQLDDGSNYPSIKVQNDVNDVLETRGISEASSSWRNITKSDESSIHNHVDADDELSVQSTSRSPSHSNTEGTSERVHLALTDHNDEELSSLTDILQTQESTISRLRRRVDELSCLLEECHLISVNRYQDVSTPEVASVRFTSPSGRAGIERKFLLDRGRLQLDTLKAAFNSPYIILDLDGLPIVLTANVDGYIPLKFEAGRTYNISCDAVPQEAAFYPSTSTNQSNYSKSQERHGFGEQSLVNGGLKADSSSIDIDASKEYSSTKNKHQSSVHSPPNSQSDKLKAMILGDKSGNAMRRLQAAAASNAPVSKQTSKPQGLSASASIDKYTHDEPVKPPRKGIINKGSRSNKHDDGSDGSSSFMDVTAAL